MGDLSGSDRFRIDKDSIKNTTLFSFVLFTAFLITLLWGLMNFVTDTYYGTLRKQEIIRNANNIESQYGESDEVFSKFVLQTANANGDYIRIDDKNGSTVYDGMSKVTDTHDYSSDIDAVAEQLKESPLNSIVTRYGSSSDGADERLIYAAKISTGSADQATLYIIAPLYPDQTTVRIFSNILGYISLIVLIVAILLSIWLSHRLSAPIQNLTKSARELSKGNFNVKFDGAGFTETKELAKALNKASYEMEKTEFYQREIIANVSHDLKTPLTMIRSYAEKIIDISGDNPEKRNSDLQIIISETERLNKLVTDMMSVSNLQSNNVELHKETFDIVQAADEVYESYLVLSQTEGFDLHFHPCKKTYVVGDRTRLMQVMANFMSNAVKYSGDEKYIDIQLVRVGKKVAFHCIDHGMGIPADEIGHVWDRYYRTSANHERRIEGTGLGLAIVKGILTLHNAKYGVNSEEGKGSDFWFELDTVKKPADAGIVEIDNGKEN